MKEKKLVVLSVKYAIPQHLRLKAENVGEAVGYII